MNQKVLKEWIKELKAFAKKGSSYQLRFPMRIESIQGDLLSPEGILCEIHAKETGTAWSPEPEVKGHLRSSMWYLDQTLSAPDKVLTWLGVNAGFMCVVRRVNDEKGFDGVVEHLESIGKTP